MTAEGFEPDPVGSPETETRGLTGSEPPPSAPQTPSGSTTTPSQASAEGEGVGPDALEPTNIGNESVGGETSNIIAGADAGVAPSETAEPNTPDAGAPPPPDASAAPSMTTPLDASTAS